MPFYNPADDDDEVKGDMTPMIDIIFLLLIFFILTTKFIPEEKVIQSMLPTDEGTSTATSPKLPDPINIRIYPALIPVRKGLAVKQVYTDIWNTKRRDCRQKAHFRIGGTESGNSIFELDGKRLSHRNRREDQELVVKELHDFIYERLRTYDAANPVQDRSEARQIKIFCFSRMPWKYALLAYDAARAYERDQMGGEGFKMANFKDYRKIAFTAPVLRYSPNDMITELFHIVNTDDRALASVNM